MKKLLLLIISLSAVFYSCRPRVQKQEETNADSTTVSSERAVQIIDSVKKTDTSQNEPERIRHIEGKEAEELERGPMVKDLIAVLKKIKELPDSAYLVVDLYDSTDKHFSIMVGVNNPNLGGSDVYGWWNYYPDTKMIVNGISFDTVRRANL